MSVSAFGEDPELVATFRTEVQARIASLSGALLSLEASPRQRDILTTASRDAHTVKGSARMLGLEDVVSLAHGAEDLLAAMRDGRVPVGAGPVDLLLEACDAITAALPGPAGAPEVAADRTGVEELVARMEAPIARRDAALGNVAPPLASPVLPAVPPGHGAPLAGPRPEFSPDPSAGPPAAPSAVPSAVPPPSSPLPAPPVRAVSGGQEEVRVSGRRVRVLLDAVGETELGGRRLLRSAQEVATLVAEASAAVAALRRASVALPPDAALATQRLTATLDQLQAGAAVGRELAEDHRDRLTLVREEAIGLAMVPVRHLLSGFPRLVRALGREGGKQVRVEISGAEVELDKQVLDAVADALTHLVTNAVDHGVEPPAERVAAGKDPVATVHVHVHSAGGAVTVVVGDDGRGIDVEAVRAAAAAQGLAPEADVTNLLFAPAVSTAPTLTRSSGRGMGLDSVRSAVEGIGGSVSVHSEPGRGTTFTVTVPVTLGVLRCLVVRVGRERYAVPVTAVVETLSLRETRPVQVGGAPVLVRAGVTLPLVDLAATLDVPGACEATSALVTRHAGPGALAWAVEALEGEAEMVVGDLGPFLSGGVSRVSGVTIDGDGRVLCVLDLREAAATGRSVALAASRAGYEEQAPGRAQARAARVLVVEDSLGVRELERTLLEAAGYEVDTAVDGADGAARLHGEPVDLVLTDVEMPGMSGFALTRTLRATPGWQDVPVVVMTSRGSEEDKREGLLAGASAYLLKHEFDQAQLVETVRRLVGR